MSYSKSNSASLNNLFQQEIKSEAPLESKMNYLHYNKVFISLNITNIGRNVESPTIWLLCVVYIDLMQEAELNSIFFMLIYSCDQTYNDQNNSSLPFLNAKYFLCQTHLQLFLKTKLLKHFKPKVGAPYLWFFHAWRHQGDPCTTRGREPSVPEVSRADRCAEDGKAESMVPLFHGSACSSDTPGCGSLDLGTPFAKGAVKMVTHHIHTHTPPD